jgi:hypothetical protein
VLHIVNYVRGLYPENLFLEIFLWLVTGLALKDVIARSVATKQSRAGSPIPADEALDCFATLAMTL